MIYKRGNTWWYEFIFAGRRVRESAKTSRKTIASEAERNRRLELEKTLSGMSIEKRENRIRSVSDVVRTYEGHYSINHRAKSVLFSSSRLAHVKRLLGTALLPDLTEGTIRTYIKARLAEGAGGRTINMELGELSRAIGHKWSALWPKVRKLEERKEVGRALSPEEERRLLDMVGGQSSPNRSQTLATFIRIALLTGMRAGEITSLTWGQIDFERQVITVGKAKSAAGTGRQIPMNRDLFAVFSAHSAWFTKRFGQAQVWHYLFPFGKPTPNDPNRPITDVTGSWKTLRKTAGVQCRLHDLRHTAATKMAEAGVPESTMLALMGHMSRAMLERYSHIRMAAKRTAMDSLVLNREQAPPGGASREADSDGTPTRVPTTLNSGPIQ
jgi:integrase